MGVKRSGFRLLQSEDTANMKTLRGMPLPQKPHPAAVKIFCLQEANQSEERWRKEKSSVLFQTEAHYQIF